MLEFPEKRIVAYIESVFDGPEFTNTGKRSTEAAELLASKEQLRMFYGRPTPVEVTTWAMAVGKVVVAIGAIVAAAALKGKGGGDRICHIKDSSLLEGLDVCKLSVDNLLEVRAKG